MTRVIGSTSELDNIQNTNTDRFDMMLRCRRERNWEGREQLGNEGVPGGEVRFRQSQWNMETEDRGAGIVRRRSVVSRVRHLETVFFSRLN